MLLTGSYRRTLDDKMRLAIPKQLRDAVGFPERTNLYLTPGTDRSLAIYTEEVLQQIGQALSSGSPVAQELRTFSRLFYAQAQPAEIDKQGRMRIPAELAKLAGLEGEVVLLGVRDHMEVWNAEVWEKFLNASQPMYDQIAEKALDGVHATFGPVASPIETPDVDLSRSTHSTKNQEQTGSL